MRTRKGVTLVVLMVAVAVMSVGIMGAVSSFRYISAALQNAKRRPCGPPCAALGRCTTRLPATHRGITRLRCAAGHL